MQSDQEKQLKEYIQLSKDNPAIDATALITETLKQSQETRITTSGKALSYFISLGFPPFGLIAAAYLYFRKETDAKHLALVCILLTIISIILFLIFVQILASSLGSDLQQMQNINTEEVREFLR